MLILFIKRLFLRVTAAVWILLLLCDTLTIIFMSMCKTMVSRDPEGVNTLTLLDKLTLTLLDNLLVPVIVLTAGTVLGGFVTMTMAQGVADGYNFTSWQQASAGINATMNYDATMQHTKQTLDHTAAEAGQTIAMPAPNQTSAPVAAAPEKDGS